MFSLGGGGDTEFTYKKIVWALLIVSILPLMINLMVHPVDDTDDAWKTEYDSITQQYYESAGVPPSASMEVWALRGIYVPYSSGAYGYTDDGWLHGGAVTINTPAQYDGQAWTQESFTVAQADNGLWYYTSAPASRDDIIPATWDSVNNRISSTDGATVYTSVTMDNAHKSDTFFTANDRTEINGHYYYGYTGYRYSFSPLHSYQSTNGDGKTLDISSTSSSLSLIWYQYNSLSGIAGQLSIQGVDGGVSYLTSQDIVKQYEGVNFTATFDMQFAQMPMHLQIRLNPAAIAAGYNIEQCWNGGYWSILVYGDRNIEDYVGGVFGGTSDFSIENMFEVFTDLFGFRLADHYEIDGWVAILASLVFSLAFYAVLLAVAVANPYMWAIIAIVGLLQGLTSLGGDWWPF